MKIKAIILPAIILAVAFTSCKKTKSECKLIPAKIIRYDCDRVIFQLQTPTLIGDATWTDVQTGQQFTNVVSFYNTCKISEFTGGNGKLITLYVKSVISNQVPNTSCFQCQAISQNPPQTKVDFTEIYLSSCENSK